MDASLVENMPDSSNTDLCPICGLEAYCGGLGVIRYDVSIDDPRFGKLFRCPNNPPEQDNQWHAKLREVGNLSSFADKSFSNFYVGLPMHSEAEKTSLKYALNAATRFAQQPTGWMLIEGSYGTGKTHLAAAIGNARLEQGDAVLFITVPDLLDHLRATYSPTSDVTYDEMFERVRKAPLLILDDLGVENPSQWAQEKLFQILNYRHTAQMPTIITTNFNIDQLDPRIRSRLADTNLTHRITISAPDYRNPQQQTDDGLHSNLHLYKDKTFENFDVVNYVYPNERQNLEKALMNAYHFAQNPEGWRLFLGDVGSGKTHLAAAIANLREQQGDQVVFLSVPDLLDYLRKAFEPGVKTSFDQRFFEVKNVPFLVLDDLDTKNASSWAKEKLFQIIDYRYIRQLPTVITSTREVEDIEPRIRVRLLDDRLCKLLAITVRESYVLRRRRQ